ncbi:MAG TPA: hypothetical protein VFS40_06680 [Gemmatimonadales bacterium]|nr:hypothetical protein [Gemmatimonadales bacterium]
MAKNESREFATMDEEQRKQFEEKPEEAKGADHKEMDFEEPRDADRMGRHYQNPAVAKTSDRDGTAADLDDERHAARVRQVAEEANRRLREQGKTPDVVPPEP